ncbi:peptidylprolyl isomerase [Helicobacter suis]|uniref:peptidylprolyl isomerase n=1 Tax=Helicobacter suis TaxID=104628 RepID=UPI002490868F|nr:peptidylprolyl isomerase [Helicobacter suis]
MISWMQKHKKYLVVTIWISTIAFVAAGMIGWGQYSFSMANGNVAKVGRVLISEEELDREHRRLLDIYSQSIPNFKDLSEKEVKALGLEHNALTLLINQALLKNLALDLGLGVSGSEVIAEIQKSTAFQNEGHFDEALYKKILQENHYRPSAFEEGIKNALLLQKISALFPQAITPLEEEAFLWPLRLQDQVRIEVLEPKEVVVTQQALRDYYNQHKNTYKKPPSYTLAASHITDTDIEPAKQEQLQAYYEKNKQVYTLQGKVQDFMQVKIKVSHDYLQEKARDLALQKYLALKNNTFKPATEVITKLPYPAEIATKIETMHPGEVLKPQKYKDGWLVVKLVSKQTDQLQSFEEAKEEVRIAVVEQEQRKWLKQEASKQLPHFKGDDIGFLSLDFKGNIHDLGEQSSKELVGYIFKHPYKEGFVILKGPKAVLYRVYSQDFKHPVPNSKDFKQVVSNLKAQSFDAMLVAMLKQRYQVHVYAK